MQASSSPRRYLSVWLRRLPTDRIDRASAPAEAERALVIVHAIKGARRLAALNDTAENLGLTPGMALADARAMYPDLAVAEADPDADLRLLDAVADWCDRYTPLIGLDAPDGLMLDIAGCAHLFGGEAALARDMVRRLAAQWFSARVAIADTVGCAWALARYGDAFIVPPSAQRAAIAPLTPAALRIDPTTVAALAQSGLKRIADLLDLPRAALAARFGQHFVRRIDQALGREDEPIMPRLPVPAYVAEQGFAEPIALERDILGTIARLAGRLGQIMEQRGDGARVLQAALFRTDGKVFRIRLGTSAPVREPAAIARLFADRLATVSEDCDPGFGFDLVRLCALAAERRDPTQTGLATPDHAAEMAHLIDRLGARLGLNRVMRLMPQESHIPECTVVALPAHTLRIAPPAEHDIPQDSLAPTRPVRLFARPETIEAIAEVPDGPPVRFRWRRKLHEIAIAEGPERIAMEWWHDEAGGALTRDYFRIESREGVRAWLFREGLYGRETGRPRWFLHGLMA